MTSAVESNAELVAQIRALQLKVLKAEETLTAMRSGQIDALVVSGPHGEQVFTLQGADHTFGVLVETMSEGALTIAADGVILYDNPRFARMIGRPLEKTESSRLADYVVEADQLLLHQLASHGRDRTECIEQPVFRPLTFFDDDEHRRFIGRQLTRHESRHTCSRARRSTGDAANCDSATAWARRIRPPLRYLAA